MGVQDLTHHRHLERVTHWSGLLTVDFIRVTFRTSLATNIVRTWNCPIGLEPRRRRLPALDHLAAPCRERVPERTQPKERQREALQALLGDQLSVSSLKTAKAHSSLLRLS